LAVDRFPWVPFLPVFTRILENRIVLSFELKAWCSDFFWVSKIKINSFILIIVVKVLTSYWSLQIPALGFGVPLGTMYNFKTSEFCSSVFIDEIPSIAITGMPTPDLKIKKRRKERGKERERKRERGKERGKEREGKREEKRK